MMFGILKEIKAGENRVICTPAEAATLTSRGHIVLAQMGCGAQIGFDDAAYADAGCTLAQSAEEVYARADLIAKVKEFEPSEFGFLRPAQILVACIHPAGHPAEVQALLRSGATAFTAEDCHRYGSPNCEAAGKQGALFGLESMLTIHGGKGKFVGGFAGAPNMNVLILGGGSVGSGALSVLHALGARTSVLDINVGTLRAIKDIYGTGVETLLCTRETIAALLPRTDMVINAVKWPKERKDFLITKDMLLLMERGSVLVDISNDEPGAIETSHETHHDNPRYIVNGVVHYCVSNIPGAIAQSASIAYAAEMLPFFISLLERGVTETCVWDGYYRRALTCYRGVLTHEETSAIQGIPWMRPEDALGIADLPLDPAPPAAMTRSENRMHARPL